jgi:AraC family transcriptional regulator of adaptative response/methylated-DNA-[protein]-cysteine methyltransferase
MTFAIPMPATQSRKIPARWRAAIERACRRIDSADDPSSLAQLAAAARMSPFHFHRVFREVTGVTPKAYVAARRAERMREELRRGSRVTEAIEQAGYGAPSRFYAESNARLGMPPRAFRDGGRGEQIRFAVGECSLGSILVAATPRGIAAIQFGDDPEPLVRGLQDRFPHADLIGGDRAFERLVARVVAAVESPSLAIDLPLDVRGTAFQQRVWRALRAIPAGETRSYADIARRIRQPSAVRAVAQACAGNPVAVAIPCHRVVRSDGGLSGYRWGIERKRLLLERERA